jgi:fatty-acyl-CoA synthase
VAVIGVPHPKWVEAVTAMVVPRKGQHIEPDEIINLCREHLAAFKVPKKVMLMDALPKTPTGKILKRDMRKSHAELFQEGGK